MCSTKSIKTANYPCYLPPPPPPPSPPPPPPPPPLPPPPPPPVVLSPSPPPKFSPPPKLDVPIPKTNPPKVSPPKPWQPTNPPKASPPKPWRPTKPPKPSPPQTWPPSTRPQLASPPGYPNFLLPPPPPTFLPSSVITPPGGGGGGGRGGGKHTTAIVLGATLGGVFLSTFLALSIFLIKKMTKHGMAGPLREAARYGMGDDGVVSNTNQTQGQVHYDQAPEQTDGKPMTSFSEPQQSVPQDRQERSEKERGRKGGRRGGRGGGQGGGRGTQTEAQNADDRSWETIVPMPGGPSNLEILKGYIGYVAHDIWEKSRSQSLRELAFSLSQQCGQDPSVPDYVRQGLDNIRRLARTGGFPVVHTHSMEDWFEPTSRRPLQDDQAGPSTGSNQYPEHTKHVDEEQQNFEDD